MFQGVRARKGGGKLHLTFQSIPKEGKKEGVVKEVSWPLVKEVEEGRKEEEVDLDRNIWLRQLTPGVYVFIRLYGKMVLRGR